MHDALRSCFKRSSLSLRWEKGMTGGRLPILSDVDIDQMKQMIVENAIEGEYIDVEYAVEVAEMLRSKRIQNAIDFLNAIECYGICEEIREFAQSIETGKTWVYQHLIELESELHTPGNIEINRIMACTPQNIELFTQVFMPIVSKIPPSLRFGADETMLQPNIIKKVLIPNSLAQPILPESIPLPHITAMCCANVFGDKMPLFIIIPQLVKIPNELEEFQHRGHAIFASTINGWETRDTFLWFCICFINFLSFFRTKLDSCIRD